MGGERGARGGWKGRRARLLDEPDARAEAAGVVEHLVEELVDGVLELLRRDLAAADAGLAAQALELHCEVDVARVGLTEAARRARQHRRETGRRRVAVEQRAQPAPRRARQLAAARERGEVAQRGEPAQPLLEECDCAARLGAVGEEWREAAKEARAVHDDGRRRRLQQPLHARQHRVRDAGLGVGGLGEVVQAGQREARRPRGQRRGGRRGGGGRSWRAGGRCAGGH